MKVTPDHCHHTVFFIVHVAPHFFNDTVFFRKKVSAPNIQYVQMAEVVLYDEEGLVFSRMCVTNTLCWTEQPISNGGMTCFIFFLLQIG